MKYLKVTVTRLIGTRAYPPQAECSMTDAYGKEHTFRDKLPIFSSEEICAADLPACGVIRCTALGNRGDGIIRVSTEDPDDVPSREGRYAFDVLPEQLDDGRS